MPAKKKGEKREEKKASAAKPHAGSPEGSPHATCGATTKSSGKPCTKSAGWRTDHPGVGKCYLHGGKTPIAHGRYSGIKRPRLAELIAKFETDPNPLDILPEVLLLRALITDYVERYDEMTDAILAWHESYVNKQMTPNPKPTQILDILSAAKFIGQIGALVERIEKSKSEGSVTLEAVNRYVGTLGMEVVAAVNEALPDADSRTKVVAAVDRRWESVAFDTGTSSKRGGRRAAEGPGEN
jgi:hypothetical protein